MFVCVRTAPPIGTVRGWGAGVVFLCSRMGEDATFLPQTPNPQPAYSTAPISPSPIIQSQEENLILRNPPPPPQDKSDKEAKEGDVLGSVGGGGAKKKQWRRNDPPWC